MRHVEKYTAECTRTVKETCDLCGEEIKTSYHGDFEDVRVWRHGIRHELGNRWPEGGSHTETTADVCGKCFRDKVKPALEAIGVKFQATDVDW